MSLAHVLALRTKEFYWTLTRVTGTRQLATRIGSDVSRAARRIAYEKAQRPRQLRQSVPHFYECDPARKKRFEVVRREYLRHSGPPSDPIRVLHFMYLLESVSALDSGDYLELGVYRGATARVISQFMAPRTSLYLLDTYEGFDEKDVQAERTEFGYSTAARFAATSAEGVLRYVTGGMKNDSVKAIRGWFPDSYSGLESRTWRFVHIDMDLYQPMKTALSTLWPSIVPGGVLLAHDYGCYGYPGASKAVDEFAKEHGLTPILLADRWGSAVLTKPRSV